MHFLQFLEGGILLLTPGNSAWIHNVAQDNAVLEDEKFCSKHRHIIIEEGGNSSVQ